MPYGVSVSDESRTLSQIKNNFIRKIKKIIARYGFDDEEWAQAISSQYFLLCIAKQLKWGKKDYANLLNKCLSCFSVTYTGDYILDSEKLLITPNETNKIVQCMQEEDNIDDYYTHSAVFNSYFTADLSRSDSLLYIKQSYNVGIWLLEFAARVLITIAVEIVVALIFGYWEKKTLLFFAAVNLATQVLLNMILALVNIRYGFLLFRFAYMFGELIVVTFEAVFYSAFIGKYSRKNGKVRAVFYAICANLASFFAGVVFSVNFTALM